MSEKIVNILKNDKESEYLMDWYTNSFESRINWSTAEFKRNPAKNADDWGVRIAQHEVEIKKKIKMSIKHVDDQIAGFESIKDALDRGGYTCESFNLLYTYTMFGIDLYRHTLVLGLNPEDENTNNKNK